MGGVTSAATKVPKVWRRWAGAWTDIFLGGATSKFARGARENFIALHLDFIALHLEVEHYTSRWSDIKFLRATKNITQHLNWGWAGSIFLPDANMPDNLAFSCRIPDIRPDNSAVPNIRLNPPLKQGFYLCTYQRGAYM